EFYRRLAAAPLANSADAALEQLSRILEEVEDELSGIPKQSPPPPPSRPDGRMYPPLADHILRLPNGGIEGRTKGNTDEDRPDGRIVIGNKRTGAEVFHK